MQAFLCVRGAKFSTPPRAGVSYPMQARGVAGSRGGVPFSRFAGWVALVAVGAFFGAWVFWGILLEEVCK